jgi:broad specificity phosphatase PhoE
VIEPNPPIYFVRHGETDWNREGRIQGQIDIPLNDNGHLQGERLARGLKWFLGATKIDRFIASPLRFAWRPPDGESYADGIERVRQWIGRLDGPTIIIAHGAIGRCLMGLVSDLAPEAIVKAPTPQGHFCRLMDGTITWFDAEGHLVVGEDREHP